MSQGSNFVDYVKICCRSGKGGAGSAHLHRDIRTAMGGPDGGDGGRGGHVIMKGNAHEWTLLPLRYTRHVKADRGQNGAKNQLTGALSSFARFAPLSPHPQSISYYPALAMETPFHWQLTPTTIALPFSLSFLLHQLSLFPFFSSSHNRS